jgi:hypothetical protein
MKVFFAKLNDDSTIHRPAERFEIVGDAIKVYLNGELVAYADIGVVLYCHMREI